MATVIFRANYVLERQSWKKSCPKYNLMLNYARFPNKRRSRFGSEIRKQIFMEKAAMLRSLSFPRILRKNTATTNARSSLKNQISCQKRGLLHHTTL